MSMLTGTNETPGSSGPAGPGLGDAKLAAAGKVTAAGEGKVVFAPAGTNYELHLLCPGYAGPIGKPVRGTIRVTARKLWTVPSGGNWIQPIFGSPRIIQGRVRALESTHLVVQGGTTIRVDLPDDDIVYDLANGPISIGVMVNVTALPGATFELQQAVARRQ
jgi:hypothetical protein